ncbi:MAG: hypothetical protein HUJ89_06540 [Bacteroidales bacterium]|nr:hypothetical protein [Bacteroidales bacterium]
MKNRLLLLIAAALLLSQGIFAETSEERKLRPHEIGVTVGDMMSETLFWHSTVKGNYSGSGNPNAIFYEKQSFAYTPHLALAYQYRVNGWLGVGLTMDFQHTSWDKLGYNNTNTQVSRSRECFFNLCIMPTAKFTYMRSKYVNLYSSVAVGLDINGGTEVDYQGHHTACGAALDLRFFGVRANYDRWYASLDLGAMFGLKRINTVYILGSKLVSFTIGVTL